MNIWRISKFTDLGGRGGLAASGRWHTRPQAVVYCSDEPHTAYLEVLKQVGHVTLLSEELRLLKINYPSTLIMEIIDTQILEPRWSSDTSGWRICRPLGDDWLRSGRSAILKVPSAARIGSYNYLINPAAYKSEEIKVVDIIKQPFGRDVTS